MAGVDSHDGFAFGEAVLPFFRPGDLILGPHLCAAEQGEPDRQRRASARKALKGFRVLNPYLDSATANLIGVSIHQRDAHGCQTDERERCPPRCGHGPHAPRIGALGEPDHYQNRGARPALSTP